MAVHQGSGPEQIEIGVVDDGFGTGIDTVTVAIHRTLAQSGKLFARLKISVAINP